MTIKSQILIVEDNAMVAMVLENQCQKPTLVEQKLHFHY